MHDTFAPEHCLYEKCAREIVQGQWEAEGDDAFKERLQSGFCRRKCARLHGPAKKERPKPTLSPVSVNYGRGGGGALPKDVPVVDEAYRRFVRSLPCLVPGCCNPSIFHHQHKKGHGAKGALCTDYRGMNICEWHHTLGGTERLPGSYHGMGKLTGWRFWQHYGVDVEATIHNLNRLWLEQVRTFKEA
jgi:hypothetical protein